MEAIYSVAEQRRPFSSDLNPQSPLRVRYENVNHDHGIQLNGASLLKSPVASPRIGSMRDRFLVAPFRRRPLPLMSFVQLLRR